MLERVPVAECECFLDVVDDDDLAVIAPRGFGEIARRHTGQKPFDELADPLGQRA